MTPTKIGKILLQTIEKELGGKQMDKINTLKVWVHSFHLI